MVVPKHVHVFRAHVSAIFKLWEHKVPPKHKSIVFTFKKKYCTMFRHILFYSHFSDIFVVQYLYFSNIFVAQYFSNVCIRIFHISLLYLNFSNNIFVVSVFFPTCLLYLYFSNIFVVSVCFTRLSCIMYMIVVSFLCVVLYNIFLTFYCLCVVPPF